MVNYLRVLNEAKCKLCGYTGFDIDFENWQIEAVAENIYNALYHIICPNCNHENTMEFLNEDKNARPKEGE